jgi:hypothetical protein
MNNHPQAPINKSNLGRLFPAAYVKSETAERVPKGFK